MRGVFLHFALPVRRRKILLLRRAQNHSAQNSDPILATPADSAQPRDKVFAARRKQTKGRIINEWMILTVILGAVITLVDGLTRAPNPWMELAPPQPLEYEPYRAAFLLAAVAFPLMFAYAKKAHISLAETLFLWFVFCTTAYMKDFSYLRLPGAPLFVTDVILFVLLFLIYISPRRRSSRRPLLLDISLAVFVAAGALAAVRGFLAHREPILVLRDSALIGYSLFLLVGYHLLGSWPAIRRVAVWFLLGTSLSVLNGFGWLLAAPEQRRLIAPGVYVLISLLGVVVMMANRLIRPRVGWILVALFSLGLLLANTRTLFVSLGILALLALFVPKLHRGEIFSARLVKVLPAFAALACLFAFFVFHLQAGRELSTRVAEELARGVLHSNDDPNWQFRLTAWKEAWRRFEEYPPAGEGFGNLFNFEIWDNDPRPHNTYLTVLYKMGLLGFLPLFSILACFFSLGLRAMKNNLARGGLHFLQIVILAQASFCIWGEANFVLESPFLASLFWTGMGMGFRLIHKLNGKVSLPILLHPLPGNEKFIQGVRGAAL